MQISLRRRRRKSQWAGWSSVITFFINLRWPDGVWQRERSCISRDVAGCVTSSCRVSSFVFSYCLGSRSWRAGITRVPVILFSDKIWRSYRSWNRSRISERATSFQFGVVSMHRSSRFDRSLAIVFISPVFSRIRENCTFWIVTQKLYTLACIFLFLRAYYIQFVDLN